MKHLLVALAAAVLAGCAGQQPPKLTVSQQIDLAQLAVAAACAGATALQPDIAPTDAAKVSATCTAAQSTLSVLSAGLPPPVAAAPAASAP